MSCQCGKNRAVNSFLSRIRHEPYEVRDVIVRRSYSRAIFRSFPPSTTTSISHIHGGVKEELYLTVARFATRAAAQENSSDSAEPRTKLPPRARHTLSVLRLMHPERHITQDQRIHDCSGRAHDQSGQGRYEYLVDIGVGRARRRTTAKNV